jgi:aspartate/methionine/tyrosine aminotransferase
MTGVIFVTTEAANAGFSAHDQSWANLGQGAPETDGFGAGEREVITIPDTPDSREYASIAGTHELRQAVADLYNELYRKGKRSQYTFENVAIAAGGRLSLTRIAAALENVRVGHLIPDYTAYEELLTAFHTFAPVPILLSEQYGYSIDSEKLRRRVQGLGLGALLLSNPSNPTGRVISGNELEKWVAVAREEECAFIFDEFYSQYLYGTKQGRAVSAAEYADDVDRDPVIIVDGLTKNLRRPGWRISWTVAPTEIISTLSSVGSFLDGGAPHPLQDAAVSLLSPTAFRKEAVLLQEMFAKKREYLLARLIAMGLEVPLPPAGAFYCWTKLSRMPAPLRSGMDFFTEALKEKVIIVPGQFFDVNPGKHRKSSAYEGYIRVSFGPPIAELVRGLDAIERMIKKFL